MNSTRKALVVLFLCITVGTTISDTGGSSNNALPSAAKTYAQLLRLRRKDHTNLIQTMLSQTDYSKNYKMITLALKKIFQVIQQSNQTLSKHNYSPSEGFPTDETEQEAVTLLLENSCLAADILLHFPEISYKVLLKISKWRDIMNWCIGFVNSFPQITNEQIVELIELARQEINEDARSPDFINPYYKKANPNESSLTKKRKPQKKIKKGPQLTTKTEL